MVRLIEQAREHSQKRSAARYPPIICAVMRSTPPSAGYSASRSILQQIIRIHRAPQGKQKEGFCNGYRGYNILPHASTSETIRSRTSLRTHLACEQWSTTNPTNSSIAICPNDLDLPKCCRAPSLQHHPNVCLVYIESRI